MPDTYEPATGAAVDPLEADDPLAPDRELVVDLALGGLASVPPDPQLIALAGDVAGAAAGFVAVVEGVARGGHADESVAVLLLELSDLIAVGARLGAMSDVVPAERLEPDTGREPDVDLLRERLGALLGPIDDYVAVSDPYADPEPVENRVSDDIALIVTDLLHGLAHHTAGRPVEALWWWQYSYLLTWGPAAMGALRALQALVAHLRFDAGTDDDEDGEV